MTRHPVVLAITGASGAPYGVRLLEVLARNRVPGVAGDDDLWAAPAQGRVRHRLAGRASRGDRRRLELGHTVSRRRPRRAARVGLATDQRDGDLSLFDGYRRRHRRGHQPLPGRARRRRHAQGAAQADPGSAGDAAVPDPSAQSGRRDRGRRGRDPRMRPGSITVPRRSPSWWTSSSSGCWIISTSRSSSPRAGPATSHEGLGLRIAPWLLLGAACGGDSDGPSGPVDEGQTPVAGCSDGTLSSGALYRTCFPPSWNGELVIYAHGYVRPDAPLEIPDDALAGVSRVGRGHEPGLRLRHHELSRERTGGRRGGH